MLKSRPDRYGAIAVSIHWLNAILILALLGSGFRAANSLDAAAKAEFLRFHIPVAIIVLLLTALRIVWWWRFDRKPLSVEGTGRLAGRSVSRARFTSPSTSSFSRWSPAASG